MNIIKYTVKKLLFILLFILLSFCSKNDSTQEPEFFTYEYSADELNLLDIVNNYRDSIGLNKLDEIQHISYECHEHNIYMIDNNVFNHDYFQSRCDNIILVLDATHVGENIAYNYQANQSALDAWLGSDGHKENIEGDWTNFGVSITEGANNRRYITMIFVKI